MTAIQTASSSRITSDEFRCRRSQFIVALHYNRRSWASRPSVSSQRQTVCKLGMSTVPGVGPDQVTKMAGHLANARGRLAPAKPAPLEDVEKVLTQQPLDTAARHSRCHPVLT
jgi:hypothetical protein